EIRFQLGRRLDLDDAMPAVEEEGAQLLAIVEAEGDERDAVVCRTAERLRERPRARELVEPRQDGQRDDEMDDRRREADRSSRHGAASGALGDEDEPAERGDDTDGPAQG